MHICNSVIVGPVSKQVKNHRVRSYECTCAESCACCDPSSINALHFYGFTDVQTSGLTKKAVGSGLNHNLQCTNCLKAACFDAKNTWLHVMHQCMVAKITLLLKLFMYVCIYTCTTGVVCTLLYPEFDDYCLLQQTQRLKHGWQPWQQRLEGSVCDASFAYPWSCSQNCICQACCTDPNNNKLSET